MVFHLINTSFLGGLCLEHDCTYFFYPKYCFSSLYLVGGGRGCSLLYFHVRSHIRTLKFQKILSFRAKENTTFKVFCQLLFSWHLCGTRIVPALFVWIITCHCTRWLGGPRIAQCINSGLYLDCICLYVKWLASLGSKYPFVFWECCS